MFWAIQPDSGDAQVLQVIELLGKTAEIAHAVFVAVVERAYVDFIDDCVFVPERVGICNGRRVVIGHRLQCDRSSEEDVSYPSIGSVMVVKA